ncbi:hypothetical protein RCL1_006025 [Eukaryota sp. TZLM3-RCL]
MDGSSFLPDDFFNFFEDSDIDLDFPKNLPNHHAEVQSFVNDIYSGFDKFVTTSPSTLTSAGMSTPIQFAQSSQPLNRIGQSPSSIHSTPLIEPVTLPLSNAGLAPKNAHRTVALAPHQRSVPTVSLPSPPTPSLSYIQVGGLRHQPPASNLSFSNTTFNNIAPSTPQEPSQSDVSSQTPSSVGNDQKQVKPLNRGSVDFATNLAATAFHGIPPNQLPTPGLCRPSFIQNNSGVFVTGTQDTRPDHRQYNMIIVSDVKLSREAVPKYYSSFHQCIPVKEPVRDVQFLDNRHIIVACGSKIVLLTAVFKVEPSNPQLLSSDHFDRFEVQFLQDCHSDDVREVAICPTDRRVFASCGFDGKLTVSRLLEGSTIIHEVLASFEVKDVLGSLRWVPGSNHLLSCTSDSGLFYTVNYAEKKMDKFFNCNKPGLYSHSYLNADNVFLAFSDGMVQLREVSSGNMLLEFADPCCSCLGDIQWFFGQSSSLNYLGVTGIGGITLWNAQNERMNLIDSGRLQETSQDPEYYASAVFLPSSPHLACVDSDGNFMLYRYG